MNCPNCQAGIPDGALFCSECGTDLKQFAQSEEVVSEEKAAEVETNETQVVEEVTEPISAEPEVISGDEVEVFSDYDDIDDDAPVTAKSAFVSVESNSVSPASSSQIESVSEPVSETVVAAPVVATTAASSSVGTTSVPASAPVTPQKSKKKLMKEEIAKLPKAYRPLSTLRVIGYYILVSIPVIGALFVLISAFAAKNRNTKSLSRAILVFFLIGLVLSLICFGVMLLMFGTDVFDLPTDLAGADSVEEMLHIVNDFVESW